MTPAAPGKGLKAGTALVFLVAFNVFFFQFARWPNLYDTDSYYHLAAARGYAQGALWRGGLPWTRFSALGEGFGDKELLFHVLLAPFAVAPDPLLGGKLALALANAGLAAALAYAGARCLGAIGLLVPLWVYLGAAELPLRTFRLRPELLSLALLLAAAWAAWGRRYRALAFVALAYALSYTAFQALLGLCLLWFLDVLVREKRAEWELLAAPAFGIAAGLLLHPQFPANLRVWYLQNVAYYAHKASLDVGLEIRPQSAVGVLALNAGWLFGLVVLWRARRRDAGWSDPRPLRFAGLAAVAFACLYLLSMRFATYAVPFVTLALLLALRGRAPTLTGWMPVAGLVRVPFALAFAACLAAGLLSSRLVRPNLAGAGVFAGTRRADAAALAAALPPGAKVAATWGDAEVYTLFAPQARYLNVLDPVFMAVPFRAVYEAQRALFAGETPDAPLVVARDLDSRYVAFTRGRPGSERLFARLAADPRAKLLTKGQEALFEIVPDADGAFVLDWRVVPGTLSLPPAEEEYANASSWPLAPRLPREAGGLFQGYVDAARVSRAECAALYCEARVEEETPLVYELAPWGRASLYLDGALVAAVPPAEAVPGRGARLPITLARGTHRLVVSTCRAGERNGFALIERPGASAPPPPARPGAASPLGS